MRELLQQALDAKVAALMKSADSYAHVYAFVGDDTMPVMRRELESALQAALAQPAQPATTREAFEASETDWVETDCPTIRVDLLARTTKGDYAQALMRLKWKVWQAATAQEREACAKLCAGDSPDADYFAEAIRARSNDE